ncbi:MAG TPA: ribokinase [Puia sp.]|nr:ribokinase [Puia sp.]
MKQHILVVGSSNTDMVAKTDRLPVPGETVLGQGFIMAAGGKGANQAVAARRLGAEVAFVAKVGDDVFGKQAVSAFGMEGIDTSGIVTDAGMPSGVALITVDARGENCIVVASGANSNLLPADVTATTTTSRLRQAALVLMQLEIPLETVQYMAECASSINIPVILNPAPARVLPDDLLKKISILVPNQQEAEMLTGIDTSTRPGAERAATELAAKGIRTVIITMGADGALVLDKGIFHRVPSPKVEAVDTTAAGDVFCGALAVTLSEGASIQPAVEFACAAAALSVTRMGAQPSAPTRAEVDRFRGRPGSH